jgi:proteasome lid subunit RPN8/RPN11
MTEVGAIFDGNLRVLYWHEPQDRTGGSLPDSRTLWDELLARREYLMGFAHSHPGGGVPGPSWTDLTTMAAVEAGLGRRLFWVIVNFEGAVFLVWQGPGKHDYFCSPVKDPPWADEMRRRSEV